jgi:hypothetical protein
MRKNWTVAREFDLHHRAPDQRTSRPPAGGFEQIRTRPFGSCTALFATVRTQLLAIARCALSGAQV